MSSRPWKFNIWSPLFCMTVVFFNSCESFCPQIWHPYWRCESKIAKYLVLRRCLLTKCLILASRPFALFNLVLGNCMWCLLNFRFSSRIIPRYFVWVNGWIFLPLIWKFRCLMINLLFDRNSISLALSALERSCWPLASELCFLSQSLPFCLCLLWT